MGRMFVLSSLIIVMLLSLNSALMPGNLMLALYSNSPYYQYFRVVLLMFLTIQLASPAPRRAWFAVLSIFLSALLIGWTLQASLNYKMEVLDTLAFLEAGLATTIISLELSTMTFRQVIAASVREAKRSNEIKRKVGAGAQLYAQKVTGAMQQLSRVYLGGRHRQTLSKR